MQSFLLAYSGIENTPKTIVELGGFKSVMEKNLGKVLWSNNSGFTFFQLYL